MLAKVDSYVLARLPHPDHGIELALVDILAGNIQVDAVLCEEGSVVSKIHTTSYNIICVKFGAI